MSMQSRILSGMATVFSVMALAITMVAPATAQSEFDHCCNSREGCKNNTAYNCEYGPECDDVDWQAECKPAEN